MKATRSNTTITMLIICSLISSLSLIACAPGGFTGTEGSITNLNKSDGAQGSLPNFDLNKLDIDRTLGQSVGVDNRFMGQKIVYLDPVTKEFVLRIPVYFAFSVIIQGAPIPSLPGASLSMVQVYDEDGALIGNAIECRIPAKYLLRGVNFLPMAKLPNGRPLPGISSGELPSTNVSFPVNIDGKKMNIFVYLGVNDIAFFIEGNWDLGFFNSLTVLVPIYNKQKTARPGYFGLIGKEGANKPGFYMQYRLPAEVSKVLEEWLGIQ